jgi:hypothetical protein
MTTPRTKSTPVIKLGKVTKTSNITFRSPAPRGSMYDDIFDQMESLKAGESFTVDVPKGVTPRTMHNRINAATRRVELEPPKGCVFLKRTTEDGKIAISCERA